MEDKIIELFKKYSKSVDTEYNVYNCLIEEDWSNIAQDVVKLFRQPDVVGRSEQLKAFMHFAEFAKQEYGLHIPLNLMKEYVKSL